VGALAIVGTLAACGGHELDADGLQERANLAHRVAAEPRGVLLLDAPSYRAPGTVKITVADSHLNARSSDVEYGRVALTSTTSPAGRSIAVRETGPNTGVFEGTATLALASTGSELLVHGGDTVMARYRDADDGTGRSATVIATAVVGDTSPDLAVAVPPKAMAASGTAEAAGPVEVIAP
jgi:hypothetical protein